jgi:hypothetical protein
LGKTVRELKATLLPEEFEDWRQFYLQFPFDDLHRYHRPAALVSVSMGGGDFQKRVDLLQPPPPSDPEQGVDFWSLQRR